MLDTSFHTVKTNCTDLHYMVLSCLVFFDSINKLADLESVKALRIYKGSN